MKVTMYQANDGTLCKTKKEQDARNEMLRLAPLAETFVAGLTGFSEDDRENETIYREDLATFIVANADALRKLLAEAKVIRKPRKSKTATAPAA